MTVDHYLVLVLHKLRTNGADLASDRHGQADQHGL